MCHLWCGSARLCPELNFQSVPSMTPYYWTPILPAWDKLNQVAMRMLPAPFCSVTMKCLLWWWPSPGPAKDSSGEVGPTQTTHTDGPTNETAGGPGSQLGPTAESPGPGAMSRTCSFPISERNKLIITAPGHANLSLEEACAARWACSLSWRVWYFLCKWGQINPSEKWEQQTEQECGLRRCWLMERGEGKEARETMALPWRSQPRCSGFA